MPTSLFEARQGPFYDAWEHLPQEERLTIQRQRLNDYVAFAQTATPFYTKRLEGFAANDANPLKNVPVLTSDDLRLVLPPIGTQLLTNPNAGYSVFQSGGTTGMPKTTLFTHEELEGLNLPNARGFYAVGLTPTDRVANLWAVGGLYMTFVHINRMLQQYGCTSFPFSNKTPNDFVHMMVSRFKINCLSGISSVVLNYLRSIPENNKENISFDKIFFGGEHMYQADRDEISNRFGVQVIAAPGYGTVDSWYIGYQCASCDVGEFHVHDDQVFVEIVDESRQTHCQLGEVGMLYTTTFPRRLTPIVRYRVGDKARWIAGDCPCGRTTPRFKLLGRGDDTVRIGFDSIDYEFIQSAVSNVRPALGSIQIEKERETGKDRLTIRIEIDNNDSNYNNDGNLPQDIADTIISARPTLREGIANGSVWPVQVHMVALNSLPRNPRTGKLMRVVDRSRDDG